MVVAITRAEYKGGFTIEFEFSDRLVRTIDFKPVLDNSRDPVTRKYLDKRNFASFRLKHGDIIWNDYELSFPAWNLHEGNV